MERTGENKSPKKYDKDAKIHSIFQTMYNLINLKDYNAINIREIAKEAGVSIGTIYLYFPDGKEGIIHEMMIYDVAKIVPNSLIDTINTTDFGNFLFQFLNNYYDFHEQYKNIILTIERARMNRPDLFTEPNSMINSESENIVLALEKNPKTKSIIEKFSSPEHFRKEFSQVMRIIDGIIHRHILYFPIFESKDEALAFFLDLLSKTLEFDK